MDFFAWLSENLPEEGYTGEQSADAPLSKAGTLAKESPLEKTPLRATARFEQAAITVNPRQRSLSDLASG